MIEKSLKELLNRPILIVVDMQEDSRKRAAGSHVKELLPLIAAFRHHNLPIIFSRHGHYKYDTGSLVRECGPPGEGSCLIYSDDWQLMKELRDVANQDEYVDKSQYGAFTDTDLEKRLRYLKVETIVVCGTVTDHCCEDTAREAVARNFEVIFLDDGCYTDDQASHERTLRNLRKHYVCQASIADVIKGLAEVHPRQNGTDGHSE